MQKSDLNNLKFFYNSNGRADEVAMSLNCFESNVYHILINNEELKKEQVVPLFIRDINPILWRNNVTGVFKISNQNSSLIPLWNKYISANKHVAKRDKNSISYLEKILDTGKPVIMQTVFQKLKYYADYNADFDVSTYDSGEANHVNILLYHEADRFYFADKIPYRVNLKNFVPYELNSQIGVISKAELAEATNYFLRYYTLEINESKLKQNEACKEDIVQYLRSVAQNYTAREEQEGDYTRYFGIAAIERLLEFCRQGVDMRNYYYTPDWGLNDRINFDMWMLHGSRRILWEYLILIKEVNGCSGNFEDLINTVFEACAQWKILQRSLSRLVRSGEFILNFKVEDRIERIIEVEDRLNMQLMNFNF
jgi:hypothetical protein